MGFELVVRPSVPDRRALVGGFFFYSVVSSRFFLEKKALRPALLKSKEFWG
jgi:hypothetical protein